MLKKLILLFILLSVFFAICKKNTKAYIKMATTTSTENSGLLKVLLPVFEKKSGIGVRVIAVGTGKAIKLASNGDVDVILVHSPPAEKKFIKAGFGIKRIPVMSNDFVIVSPKSDRAKVNGLKDPFLCLKKIAKSKSNFISRGDHSGTHDKEMQLWKQTGISPKGKWYISAGRGMGEVLMMAFEKQAYTLSDRGTYLAYKNKIALEIQCQRNKALLNPYSIIAVNPKRFKNVKIKKVQIFITWITSTEGQKLIADFKLKGETLFFPN